MPFREHQSLKTNLGGTTLLKLLAKFYPQWPQHAELALFLNNHNPDFLRVDDRFGKVCADLQSHIVDGGSNKKDPLCENALERPAHTKMQAVYGSKMLAKADIQRSVSRNQICMGLVSSPNNLLPPHL